MQSSLRLKLVLISISISFSHSRRGVRLPGLARMHHVAEDCRPGGRPAVQVQRVQQDGLHWCAADGPWPVFAQQTEWGKFFVDAQHYLFSCCGLLLHLRVLQEQQQSWGWRRWTRSRLSMTNRTEIHRYPQLLEHSAPGSATAITSSSSTGAL